LSGLKRNCKSSLPAELKRIREFPDDVVEDNLTFKEEFEAAIRESEAEMTSGK